MSTDGRTAWAALEPPWRLAIDQAWTSACAGSLGIGAVVTTPAVADDGFLVVATGRNRILEDDPGDDHLAGSTLAHAEANALAKLRWRAHDHHRLTLWSTLEPCLMCLSAIRMAPIAEVRYLTADPLFDGVQAIRDVNEFVASRWPDIRGPEPGPLGVLGLVFPAHCSGFWRAPLVERWVAAFPRTMALVADLVASGELVAAAEAGTSAEDVVVGLWDRLAGAAAADGTST